MWPITKAHVILLLWQSILDLRSRGLSQSFLHVSFFPAYRITTVSHISSILLDIQYFHFLKFASFSVPDNWITLKCRTEGNTSNFSTYLRNVFSISSWVIASSARLPWALTNSSLSSIRSSLATSTYFSIYTCILTCNASMVMTYIIPHFHHINATLEWIYISTRVVKPRSNYRQTSNISHLKSFNLHASRLVLKLSFPNPLKPGVKSRIKI